MAGLLSFSNKKMPSVSAQQERLDEPWLTCTPRHLEYQPRSGDANRKIRATAQQRLWPLTEGLPGLAANRARYSCQQVTL